MFVQRVKEWLRENENIKNLIAGCLLDSLDERIFVEQLLKNLVIVFSLCKLALCWARQFYVRIKSISDTFSLGKSHCKGDSQSKTCIF